MRAIEDIIDEVEAIKKRKQTLLALVRGGHEQPKGMTQEEAIKVLLADIRECDEFIAEARVADARVEIECRSRFFT